MSRPQQALVAAYTSSATRRALPIRAAFAMIEAAAKQARRRELGVWKAGRDFQRELLRHTPKAGREDEVAERTLVEVFSTLEIFWRPWLAAKGQSEGLQHWWDAKATGRGIVVVFPRFGVAALAAPIMRREGVETWAIVSPHHYEGGGGGFDGAYARRAAAYFDMLGEGHQILHGKDTTGTFARANELLTTGRSVATAFDVGGSMPTPFLGRTVRLASGPVKMAAASDSLILPFVMRRRGAVPILTWAPPLDPRDHDSPESLQAALAGVIADWALEEPESVWPLLAEPGGPPLIREAAPERTPDPTPPAG